LIYTSSLLTLIHCYNKKNIYLYY